MNTEYIKTFISLASTGSFTKTAQELMVVQSTVSNRIKDLESKIGRKLFVRDTSSVSLTLEGQVFLDYAYKFLELEDAATTEINMLANYLGRLRIASPHTLFDSYLSAFTLRFMKEHPSISLEIDIAHSQEILPNLNQHKYDIAFSYFPFSHSQYICVPHVNEHVVLVANAANDRYKAGITLKEVKELTYIYTDYLTIVDFDWFIPQKRIYPLNLNIMSKAVTYLSNNDYYCFLPRELLQTELTNGTLIEIPILDAKMPVNQSFLIYRKNDASYALSQWIRDTERYLSAP